MEYRVLGRTGVKVAPLCFGSDNFADPTPEPECVRMLETAMDAGINLIDTGEVYAEGEGERIIGRALKANGRRQDLLIATKVDHGRRVVGESVVDYTGSIGPNEYGHSRVNLIRACEALAQAPADRLDRPLSTASPLARDAVRRNPEGAGRPGPRRQDPLHRLLDPPRPGWSPRP